MTDLQPELTEERLDKYLVALDDAYRFEIGFQCSSFGALELAANIRHLREENERLHKQLSEFGELLTIEGDEDESWKDL